MTVKQLHKRSWDVIAFHFDEETDYAQYLDRLRRERQGAELENGWVPTTYLVAVLEGRIVGRVSLRHELNDFLRDFGGHIGFGVVASYRGKGIGRELMRLSLPRAKSLGLERVLVTCSDENLGSRRIIESCGGVLEDSRRRLDGGLTRRYWVDCSKS